MNTREIGNSGIAVRPIAFGGNVLGWTADEPTSYALLDRFADRGFNLIDTADVYSAWVPGHAGGESETLIGKWLQGRGERDKFVIATKVGMEMQGRRGLSKARIFTAVEDSLVRLQTDYIDLYQSHCDDEPTPLDETLEAYARLIEQGKVRAIGASNYSGARLTQALELSERAKLPRYECLQPKYNLVERATFEQELEPVCREHGIGVICYYGLASGFLTGKYRSAGDVTKSVRGKAVVKYLDAPGFRVLAALDAVAARLSATPAQVALAWLIARPTVTAPIVSATSAAQLDEILGAASLVLDAAAIAELDAASAP